MEIDITKLQLLNDRISQTIDALCHLKAATPGLSHSGSYGWTGAPGVGATPPWATSPYGAWNSPFVGQQGISPFVGMGLGHTANPYGAVNPYLTGMNYSVPVSSYGYPSPMFGAGFSPYGVPYAGLSHTGAIDPRFIHSQGWLNPLTGVGQAHSAGIDPRFLQAQGYANQHVGVGPFHTGAIDPRFSQAQGWVNPMMGAVQTHAAPIDPRFLQPQGFVNPLTGPGFLPTGPFGY